MHWGSAVKRVKKVEVGRDGLGDGACGQLVEPGGLSVLSANGLLNVLPTARRGTADGDLTELAVASPSPGRSKPRRGNGRATFKRRPRRCPVAH